MSKGMIAALVVLLLAVVGFQFGLAWYLIQINLKVLDATGMPHEGITGAMIGLTVGVGNTTAGAALINYIQNKTK